MLAITLQMLLSLGHAHRFDTFRPGALSPLVIAALHGQPEAEAGAPASKPVGLVFEYCAICAVIKMGAAAVPAEAPASGAPFIVGKVRFARYAEASASRLERLLFEARAPPSA